MRDVIFKLDLFQYGAVLHLVFQHFLGNNLSREKSRSMTVAIHETFRANPKSLEIIDIIGLNCKGRKKTTCKFSLESSKWKM